MARFCIGSINSIGETAREFLEQFKYHRIFAFYGELGIGKTTFIKALCKELGVGDIISSPSFSIINEYMSEQHGRIYHFDFYRVEKLEEAFDIGYEDYFFSGQYCFIEWADKVQVILPPGTIHIHMIPENNSGRILEVTE